jgi:translation initiation factor 2 subunit 3
VPITGTKGDRLSEPFKGSTTTTTNMTAVASSSVTMETLLVRESEVLERQATHLVGTLGHVSEGKSTLVRALTGVRTQRYASEQHRNITIHLGYANCKVWQHRVTGALQATPTGSAPPEPVADWALTAHLSFVDCPGHEAYLATMLGGASVMDTACLLIAANNPPAIPQPQTLEHLIAAELTGMERIAVVPNKLDLVTAEAAAAAEARIRTFVADSVADPARGAPMFPISAQHGWGVSRVLDWLVGLPPPPRDLTAPAALTCVRSFDVNRPGPFSAAKPLAGGILGGPLDRGVLAIGDWLELRPGILKRSATGAIVAKPLLTRVTGLRCEGTELPYAVPGSLIAIATELDPALTAGNGMVGQRVGVPGTLPPTVGELTVTFRRLKREVHEFGRHRAGDRLRVCSGVMTAEGTVTELEGRRSVTVVLDRPLCVGVGETVSVLRAHPEAGRELLEGVGLVATVMAWPDQEAAEGAELAVTPTRTVVWEPMERPEFSSAVTVPAYADLVADVMARKEELEGSGSLRLELPVLDRIPKHTVVVNWPALHGALVVTGVGGEPAYAAHLQDFLERDLSTTSSVNADGQLILRGFWREEDLRSLLRRYVATYKRCLQCRGYNTGLVTVDGVVKVRCARCRTDNAVAS